MRKSVAVLLAVLISTLTTFFVTYYVIKSDNPVGDDALPLTEFGRVEQIIDNYYLRDYDMKDVQYAGLKAMVASLDDPYSVYYTPEEYEMFTQEAAGEYYGVGMVIAVDEASGLARVEYFFDGSSAEEAGIEVGDLIVSIDGVDVTQKTLQEIGVMCVGEEGTSITIGIKRGETQHEFQMQRRAIARDMLAYTMLDDGIGYMRIAQFGGNCETLFIEAIDYFTAQNARGLVVDLRDNPGGFLNTVVHVLDVLLPEGTLVYTEDKNDNRETSTSDADCIDVPMVVIVNGNTASAAEIFAGAVQDYDYGEIVGTTTYGKGVVQDLISIPSTGGGMKITTSEYFTPNGRSIDGNGIYPDFYVELQKDFIDNPETYTFDADAQISKAIEVLKQNMG